MYWSSVVKVLGYFPPVCVCRVQVCLLARLLVFTCIRTRQAAAGAVDSRQLWKKREMGVEAEAAALWGLTAQTTVSLLCSLYTGCALWACSEGTHTHTHTHTHTSELTGWWWAEQPQWRVPMREHTTASIPTSLLVHDYIQVHELVTFLLVSHQVKMMT